MSDLDYLQNILNKNKDKSFVKRILNKQNSPVLQNDDGTTSTHSMAWGSADGKYYVYPTVLLGKDGKLKRYDDSEAWNHVMKTGNFIEFNSPEDADWFSRSYKKVWGNDPSKY